jgi:hypothetical protein
LTPLGHAILDLNPEERAAITELLNEELAAHPA